MYADSASESLCRKAGMKSDHGVRGALLLTKGIFRLELAFRWEREKELEDYGVGEREGARS